MRYFYFERSVQMYFQELEEENNRLNVQLRTLQSEHLRTSKVFSCTVGLRCKVGLLR